MTDRELAAQADAAFRKTTTTYATWLKNVKAGKYPAEGPPSQFGIGFGALAQIGVTVPPPPTSGSPTLQHPYAADSVWNTPITNPVISPDNDAQMAEAVANWVPSFGPTANSVPSIYATKSDTPLVDVCVNFPTCGAQKYKVPLDPSWVPGSGGVYGPDVEAPMVVYDSVTGDEWNLFKLTKPGQPTLHSDGGPNAGACTGNYWSCNRLEVSRGASGGGWKGNGIGSSPRGSGVLYGPGTITPEDTWKPAGSDWGHALVMAYWKTRQGSFVPPATISDGAWIGSNTIPMGACFWLPPGFDIESSGMWEWQKAMCRTIRKYGIYIVDSGQAIGCEGLASVRARGQKFAWENVDQGNWDYLPASVVSKFKVIYHT